MDEPARPAIRALPNAHLPFGGPIVTGSLYLNAEDVDPWWNPLKNKMPSRVSHRVEYGMCYPGLHKPSQTVRRPAGGLFALKQLFLVYNPRYLILAR